MAPYEAPSMLLILRLRLSLPVFWSKPEHKSGVSIPSVASWSFAAGVRPDFNASRFVNWFEFKIDSSFTVTRSEI